MNDYPLWLHWRIQFQISCLFPWMPGKYTDNKKLSLYKPIAKCSAFPVQWSIYFGALISTLHYIAVHCICTSSTLLHVVQCTLHFAALVMHWKSTAVCYGKSSWNVTLSVPLLVQQNRPSWLVTNLTFTETNHDGLSRDTKQIHGHGKTRPRGYFFTRVYIDMVDVQYWTISEIGLELFNALNFKVSFMRCASKIHICGRCINVGAFLFLIDLIILIHFCELFLIISSVMAT